MKRLDKNIVLIGMPGCGKTTIGGILARKLNVKFIDIDKFIEKEKGMSIEEMFERGEEYFREVESEAVYKVSRKKVAVISTGGGVIKNPQNIESLRENGILIFIDRPLENIVKSVKISKRPLLKHGTHKIYELFNERYELYKKYCNYRIVNDGTLADATDKIISKIK